jgi:Kdo2-lipid IVA lauroyltransferase/acyltransferase
VNVGSRASFLVGKPGHPSRARHQSEEIVCPPQLRDLRFRLEYAALRGVIALLRLMPLPVSVRWSATLWRILAPRLNPKRQRVALENLRIAFPDIGEQERLAICTAHWENLGRVVAEMVQIDRLLSEPSRIEIPDQRLLARYHGKLGALIGVSLHSGNWELAIWPLVLAGANPAALYRAVGNPYIDRYLRGKRQALCPAGLIGRHRPDASPLEDLRTAHRLMDHVRTGGRVGIVCDQYYKRGVPVPFFGRTTLVPPIAAIIARRTGARVWMARCLRIGTDSRFRIEIKELRVPRSANQADDVRYVLSAIHAQFESWIREAPSQWLWSHRIWT